VTLRPSANPQGRPNVRRGSRSTRAEVRLLELDSARSAGERSDRCRARLWRSENPELQCPRRSVLSRPHDTDCEFGSAVAEVGLQREVASRLEPDLVCLVPCLRPRDHDSMRRPDWGLKEKRWEKAPNEEVRPAKTAWDVLQLLIVPVMLVLIALYFNASQASRDRSPRGSPHTRGQSAC
jgi:hypothetical protein